MVFYFSGTGNSLWVAKELSQKFGEEMISIAGEMQNASSLCYELKPDERIFFVFPVHSWGPAVLVSRFIQRFTWQHYDGQPVYTVCTCGDECGYTDRKMKELLHEKAIRLTASYSLVMPNNYILLPGFGVDPQDVEKDKLEKAPSALQTIIEAIRSGEESSDLYKTGSLPWLKSRVIYPAFAKYAVGKNSFYATDACIGCGLCVKVCPTNTIRLQENKHPVWNNTCVQCTACIHRCPVRAIEYGKVTQKQGRYFHPDLK
ncbi:MAG: EFR1 family ferrodoxin [Bacteroidales bacterium]|nr:EFR1 family ferrodoxin [Bacteroidales bacterium]